jgi:hydrogenase expression/formation protein HypC
MMCLAVPGKLIECHEDLATVDLQGNRLRISRVLVPDARPGDWVLVHAGFGIARIEEQDALETWSYLQSAGEAPIFEDGAMNGEPAGPREHSP